MNTQDKNTYIQIIELERWFSSLQSPDRVRKAFALSYFLRCAVFPNSYEASKIWETEITLTEAGQTLASFVSNIDDSIQKCEINAALFSLLTYHGFLIDLDSSNLDTIQNWLDDEMRKRSLRWPHIFGRFLYDQFNDHAPQNWIDHIPAGNSFEFLNNSQGVFQVYNIVSGPLGLLEGKQQRLIPPTLKTYLWHCSDPGCRTLHQVQLTNAEHGIQKARAALKSAALKHWGPASPWDQILRDKVKGSPQTRLRKYYDISVLIAECVFDQDRTQLLHKALRSDSSEFLRTNLSRREDSTKHLKLSPLDLACSCTADEQLQLLTTLSDNILLSLLDKSVFDQTILIPPNEERRARIKMPKRDFTEAPTALSSLGIRELINEPTISLCALIWRAYTESSNTTELAWRIRSNSGTPSQESLMVYLRDNSPETAINNLILSSRPITKFAVEELQYSGGLETPELINHLLWKIGFEVPRYKDIYKRLRERIQFLSDTILEVGTVRNETDREKIRSAGVNVFVSIEQLIDEIVSYCVWLLSSDHFLDTLFVYSLTDARAKVAQVLGASLRAGETEMHWDPNGANTLGTLYRYLQETSSWARGLLGKNKDTVRRVAKDIPHYEGRTEKEFIFYHTCFWADIHSSNLAAFVEDFSSLAKKFDAANPSSIRNGLDHQRIEADFPTSDAILAFVAKFREALDHADLQRYVPKEYWMATLNQDQYGRTEHTFRDYAERKVILYEPGYIAGIPNLDTEHAILIAPGSLFGQHSPLTFKIREMSNFSEYWKTYPRRRFINPEDSQVATSTKTEHE